MSNANNRRNPDDSDTNPPPIPLLPLPLTKDKIIISDLKNCTNILKRVDQNLINTISYYSTWKYFNEDKRVIKIINNTYAAVSFDLIGKSLMSMVILNLRKILDAKNKDRMCLPRLITILKKKDIRAHYSSNKINKKHLDKIILIYDNCYLKEDSFLSVTYLNSFKNYRDSHLVHDLSEGITNHPRYGQEIKIINLLRALLRRLHLIIEGYNRGYNFTHESCEKSAKQFLGLIKKT